MFNVNGSNYVYIGHWLLCYLVTEKPTTSYVCDMYVEMKAAFPKSIVTPSWSYLHLFNEPTMYLSLQCFWETQPSTVSLQLKGNMKKEIAVIWPTLI